MMTPRQRRMIRLIDLLVSGQPVSADKVLRTLGCSAPTLTRTLNDIRHTYQATIVYHRAGHTYQMTDKGAMSHAVLASLGKTEKALPEQSRRVSLTRNPKRRVRLSLSLPRSLAVAITRQAKEEGISRSKWMEQLACRELKTLGNDEAN